MKLLARCQASKRANEPRNWGRANKNPKNQHHPCLFPRLSPLPTDCLVNPSGLSSFGPRIAVTAATSAWEPVPQILENSEISTV